jgi:hypothetical protein
VIEYKIIVSNTKTTPARYNPVAPDAPDYKEHVFRRTVAALTMKRGDRIKVRGTANRGVIKRIYFDIKDVRWRKNKPEFIEIEMDNGDPYLVHPSSIKRSKI